MRRPVSVLPSPPVRWVRSETPVSYPEALHFLDQEVTKVKEGAGPLVWLLEHPSLYTAGAGMSPSFCSPDGLPAPFFESSRGGKLTYHGPGQQIVYVIGHLEDMACGQDVRAYVHLLETWGINFLARFNLAGFRDTRGIGVWTGSPLKKVISIGVRISRWVSSHGFALNIGPDLDFFSKISPCGLEENSITSLNALGFFPTFQEVETALRETCPLWG